MSLADKTLATKLRDICFERKRKGRVSARRRGDRNKKYRFARFPRRDRTKTRRAGSSRHRIDPRLSVDFLDKYQIFARRIYNIIFKRFPEKTHRKRHERILQRDKLYGIARYFSERDRRSGEHARFQVHHRATLRWSAAFLSRVKLIRIIIITLNPSSLRLTSKCVIFSVLGGALSSARKKSRRRYANFSCRGGKKKRERERLTRARFCDSETTTEERTWKPKPSSSSRPFRRREIRAASIVPPSTALRACLLSLLCVKLEPLPTHKIDFFYLSRKNANPTEKTKTKTKTIETLNT